MPKELLFRLILTSLYSIAFYIGYLTYMHPIFGYFGFLYEKKAIGWYIYTYLLCVAPLFFYKKGKISSFLSAILYLLLYIPVIIFYTFFPENVSSRHVLVQLSCFLGMTMFFLVGKLKYKNPIKLSTPILTPKWIFIITILLNLYLLFHFRGNIRLPSFADVYDLRSENNELSSTGGMSYIILWLTYFFMPFNLAYGLVAKKYLVFILGCLTGLFIYMTTGAKMAFFFPLFSYGFYLLFRNGKIAKLYIFLAGGLATLLIVPILLGLIFPDNEVLQWTNSILLIRTVGNGGLLTYWYDIFFTTHPHTFLSHVNIINVFTNMYPYQQSIGEVVGKEYWNTGMNANANFWATDGIAGFGSYGILLISFFFSLVLGLLDYLSANIDQLFVVLIFLPFATVFLNVSIFTSLLSGGVFFTLLFLAGKQATNNYHVTSFETNS